MVAYSGGMDSHCLLHMLAHDDQLKAKTYAVHVNHGLSQNAAMWMAHCQQVCDRLDIPLEVIKIKFNCFQGDSLEAIARTERYQALAKLIKMDEALLTAHHLDDQAETTLLQLFRGAGVAGLAGMPQTKRFAKGWQVRPLLEVTRKDLLRYAREHHLTWVEDESNQNSRFSRNYLRNEIMPILMQKWPSVAKTIARSSQHCAQTIELLTELVELDLQNCLKDDNALSIEKLMTLSIARQINVLRFWLQQLTQIQPNQNTLARILQELITAKLEAVPEIHWHDKIIRRFQKNLYCTSQPTEPLFNQEYFWDWQTPFVHNQLNLIANTKFGFGLDKEKLPKKLRISFRQGGEKIKPYKRQQTHRLKKLFQEWRIPPWQRAHIPLVFSGNELIAVVGYCYHHDYVVSSDKHGIIFERQ